MLKRGLKYGREVREQRYSTDIVLTSFETALERFVIFGHSAGYWEIVTRITFCRHWKSFNLIIQCQVASV